MPTYASLLQTKTIKTGTIVLPNHKNTEFSSRLQVSKSIIYTTYPQYQTTWPNQFRASKPWWFQLPIRLSYVPGTTKGLGNSLSIQSRFICARYKCEITFANGYNWKIKNIWRGGGRVYIWSNNNLHGSIISKKQKQTNKNFLFHDFPFAAAPSRWFLKWLRSCCACVIHSSICHHLSHVSWLLSHKIYSRKLNT